MASEPKRAQIQEHHVICEQHGESCGTAERLQDESVLWESSQERIAQLEHELAQLHAAVQESMGEMPSLIRDRNTALQQLEEARAERDAALARLKQRKAIPEVVESAMVDKAVAAERRNLLKLLNTVADILTGNVRGAAWNAIHEEEADIVAVLERMRAAERERCAKIAETSNYHWYAGKMIATAIRKEPA